MKKILTLIFMVFALMFGSQSLTNLNYSSSIKCSHKSQFKDVLL